MLGFYDSGKGGILFAESVHQKDPSLDITVVLDTSHLPLGNKSEKELKNIVVAGCQALFDQGCQLVCLACNTASVNTIRYIQQDWLPQHYPGKQVLGISTPLIEKVVQNVSKSDRILILGTEATIRSNFYTKELQSRGFSSCIALACPGLADAIEEGRAAAFTVLDRQLPSLLIDNTVDTIALACTHYSLYVPEYLAIYYPTITIIDPLDGYADSVIGYIQRHPEYVVGKTGEWKVTEL